MRSRHVFVNLSPGLKTVPSGTVTSATKVTILQLTLVAVGNGVLVGVKVAVGVKVGVFVGVFVDVLVGVIVTVKDAVEVRVGVFVGV